MLPRRAHYPFPSGVCTTSANIWVFSPFTWKPGQCGNKKKISVCWGRIPHFALASAYITRKTMEGKVMEIYQNSVMYMEDILHVIWGLLMNDSLQSISLFLSFSVHGIYRRNPEENTQALLSSITFSLAHICTCTRTHTHIHASSIHNFLLHGSGTESGKYLVLELLLSCLLQTIFKGKIMKISTSKSLSKVSFLPFTCHKCSICNSTWTL